MSKDAYYFSHDSNARYDPDILAMVSVYGMAGYGWYWVIIEILREQEDYKFNITKEHSYNAIAMQLYIDCNAAKKFIEDCINEFDLFISDGENFWSESLLNRMEILANKRQKMKDNANKRWGNQDENNNNNAKAMQKQCKSNASKVKESKVNNNTSPKNPKEFSDDSNEIKLSQLLFEKIHERDLKCKVPDFYKWAIYIDKLIRLDKRNPEIISQVINWCQNDDFWQNNILSTEKLRTQFSQLLLKMDKKKNNKPKPSIGRKYENY